MFILSIVSVRADCSVAHEKVLVFQNAFVEVMGAPDSQEFKRVVNLLIKARDDRDLCVSREQISPILRQTLRKDAAAEPRR